MRLLGERNVVKRDSLLRSLNEQLDPFALLDLRKSIFRILKLDLAGNELLDRDASGSNEVNGGLVVACAVSEGSLDVQFLGAHGHDGEVDVGLAHAALENVLMNW